MFGKFATKIFGSRNQRNLKRMGRMVDLINSLEEQIAGLDDGGLAAKTDEFRRRADEGEGKR